MTLKGEARTKYMRDYMRRRRAGQQAKPKPRVPASDVAKDARIRELEGELVQAHKRIAELEQRGRSQGQLKVAHNRPVEFIEVSKLRAEIGRLKSDIIKLKAMLQEEPDAAKLRKKVADQQAEMASMRRVMKEIAKERDQYQNRVKAYRQPKHQEARRLLTRKNHNVLLNALHSDRSKHVTVVDLATAERLVVALRPLFDED